MFSYSVLNNAYIEQSSTAEVLGYIFCASFSRQWGQELTLSVDPFGVFAKYPGDVSRARSIDFRSYSYVCPSSFLDMLPCCLLFGCAASGFDTEFLAICIQCRVWMMDLGSCCKTNKI